MKKKHFIICVLISVTMIILGITISFVSNDTSDNLVEENPQNEPSMFFKNISFIKSTYLSDMIFVYDNKYVIDKYYKEIYDMDGNLLLDLNEYDYFKYVNGYIKVEKDGKVGLIGKDLKLLIELKYYDIEVMSDDCLLLEVLNKTDSTITTTVYNVKTKKEYGPYSGIYYYNDDLIFLVNSSDDYNVEYYSLDLKKDILKKQSNLEDYSLVFSEVFNNDYIILDKLVDWEGYKKGVVGNNFNVIIPFEYDEIQNISDKFLLLEKNDLYELVTINNKKILSLNDVEDVYLDDNIIVVEKENEAVDYYSKDGNVIYSTIEHSYIESLSEDKYLIDDFNKCVYIDMDNNNLKNEVDYSFCEYSFNKL